MAFSGTPNLIAGDRSKLHPNESYFYFSLPLILLAILVWYSSTVPIRAHDLSIKRIFQVIISYCLLFYLVISILSTSFRVGTIIRTAYFLVDYEDFENLYNNPGFVLGSTPTTVYDSIIDIENVQFKITGNDQKILEEIPKGARFLEFINFDPNLNTTENKIRFICDSLVITDSIYRDSFIGVTEIIKESKYEAKFQKKTSNIANRFDTITYRFEFDTIYKDKARYFKSYDFDKHNNRKEFLAILKKEYDLLENRYNQEVLNDLMRQLVSRNIIDSTFSLAMAFWPLKSTIPDYQSYKFYHNVPHYRLDRLDNSFFNHLNYSPALSYRNYLSDFSFRLYQLSTIESKSEVDNRSEGYSVYRGFRGNGEDRLYCNYSNVRVGLDKKEFPHFYMDSLKSHILFYESNIMPKYKKFMSKYLGELRYDTLHCMGYNNETRRYDDTTYTSIWPLYPQELENLILSVKHARVYLSSSNIFGYFQMLIYYVLPLALILFSSCFFTPRVFLTSFIITVTYLFLLQYSSFFGAKLAMSSGLQFFNLFLPLFALFSLTAMAILKIRSNLSYMLYFLIIIGVISVLLFSIFGGNSSFGKPRYYEFYGIQLIALFATLLISHIHTLPLAK